MRTTTHTLFLSWASFFCSIIARKQFTHYHPSENNTNALQKTYQNKYTFLAIWEFFIYIGEIWQNEDWSIVRIFSFTFFFMDWMSHYLFKIIREGTSSKTGINIIVWEVWNDVWKLLYNFCWFIILLSFILYVESYWNIICSNTFERKLASFSTLDTIFLLI